jgi:hypothetical protein
MPVCKQPVATLVLHATAKKIPWPTLHSHNDKTFLKVIGILAFSLINVKSQGVCTLAFQML